MQECPWAFQLIGLSIDAISGYMLALVIIVAPFVATALLISSVYFFNAKRSARRRGRNARCTTPNSINLSLFVVGHAVFVAVAATIEYGYWIMNASSRVKP